MTEHELQNKIIDYLVKTGWEVIRVNSVAKNQKSKAYIYKNINVSAGLPDVLALKGNKYLWIEVKTPTGKLLPSQVRVLERFRACNISYVIVSDFELFYNWIQNY